MVKSILKKTSSYAKLDEIVAKSDVETNLDNDKSDSEIDSDYDESDEGVGNSDEQSDSGNNETDSDNDGMESFDEISDVEDCYKVDPIPISNGTNKNNSKEKAPKQSKKENKLPNLTSQTRMSQAMAKILENAGDILSESVKDKVKVEKKKVLEICQSDGTLEKIYVVKNPSDLPPIQHPKKSSKEKFMLSAKDAVFRRDPAQADPRKERSLRVTATRGVIVLLNELERYKKPELQTEEEKGRNMFTKNTEVGAVTTTKKGNTHFITQKRKGESRSIFGEKKSKKSKKV